jgi:hypothetical protein
METIPLKKKVIAGAQFFGNSINTTDELTDLARMVQGENKEVKDLLIDTFGYTETDGKLIAPAEEALPEDQDGKKNWEFEHDESL